MTDMVEVKHEGIEGTAKVPRTALPHMKGWTVVDETSPAENAPKGSTGWSSSTSSEES